MVFLTVPVSQQPHILKEIDETVGLMESCTQLEVHHKKAMQTPRTMTLHSKKAKAQRRGVASAKESRFQMWKRMATCLEMGIQAYTRKLQGLS